MLTKAGLPTMDFYNHPGGPQRGGLVKTQDSGLHLQRFGFSRSGVGLRTCISNKFPGDADAADLGTTLENRGQRAPFGLPKSFRALENETPRCLEGSAVCLPLQNQAIPVLSPSPTKERDEQLTVKNI